MKKTFQYVYLFLQAYLSKHALHLVVSFGAGLLIAIAGYALFPYLRTVTISRTIRIGHIGRFDSSRIPISLESKISLGLTRLLPDGEASASSAWWEVNDTGTVYRFTLDPALTWHDETPFTAKDVQYRFRDMTITEDGERTVVITLKDPYAPLPVLVSKPLLKDSFVGLGSYKVQSVLYDGNEISHMTLTSTTSAVPSYRYTFYSNINSAILAYKLGEIDRIDEISDPQDLATWNNTVITEKIQWDRVVGLFFNLRKDLFTEKEIRQALGYAIDTIPNTEKAVTFLSPLSWAYSPRVKLYGNDPESARKILSDSPLASSSSSLVISTFPNLLSTAQHISENWNRIGISSRVKVIHAVDPDFDVLVTTQMIPNDPDQYQYWHSTQTGTNITGYSNPKIDKFLEDGRRELDKEKRKKIYYDLQRYLVDDAPAIFLYYPKSYAVTRK